MCYVITGQILLTLKGQGTVLFIFVRCIGKKWPSLQEGRERPVDPSMFITFFKGRVGVPLPLIGKPCWSQ